MENRTHIHAEDGKQELTILREFDLPVELLFTAHTDPEILEQWMGSRAVIFEAKPNGRYQLQKRDEQGHLLFGAHGIFHEFIPNQKITRTFEMENAPFDVQLEFFEFTALTDNTSKLTMQLLFRSVALRDQLLQMPFAAGLNMAHNRLQEILTSSK